MIKEVNSIVIHTDTTNICKTMKPAVQIELRESDTLTPEQKKAFESVMEKHKKGLKLLSE